MPNRVIPLSPPRPGSASSRRPRPIRRILQTLNAAINDIVKSPAVAKKLTDMGFDPITGSQAEADAMFTAEVKKWGDMVKALGLSIK